MIEMKKKEAGKEGVNVFCTNFRVWYKSSAFFKLSYSSESGAEEQTAAVVSPLTTTLVVT